MSDESHRHSSEDDEDDETKEDSGFCHFNENSGSNEFTIDLFGYQLTLAQNPIISEMGHGKTILADLFSNDVS
jgi:hypothetical protein